MRWFHGITDSVDMSLGHPGDGEGWEDWRAAVGAKVNTASGWTTAIVLLPTLGSHLSFLSSFSLDQLPLLSPSSASLLPPAARAWPKSPVWMPFTLSLKFLISKLSSGVSTFCRGLPLLVSWRLPQWAAPFLVSPPAVWTQGACWGSGFQCTTSPPPLKYWPWRWLVLWGIGTGYPRPSLVSGCYQPKMTIASISQFLWPPEVPISAPSYLMPRWAETLFHLLRNHSPVSQK